MSAIQEKSYVTLPEHSGKVWGHLEHVDAAMEELHTQLGALENRLDPALSQFASDREAGEPPREVASALSTRVIGIDGGVRLAIDRVRSLLERLEV